MERLSVVLFATIMGVGLSAIGFSAVADDGEEDEFEANLRGFGEVPVISTAARGKFMAELSEDGMSMTYRLTFSGLQGDVRQAHIHLGQKGVNGGISIWLCETSTNSDPFAEGAPGDAPTCPQSGTVTGTLSAINVVGPSGQGIAAGEFAEIVAALQAGVTYTNVHSSTFPGGEIRGQNEDD